MTRPQDGGFRMQSSDEVPAAARIARVAIPGAFTELLDYVVPDRLAGVLREGARVRAPLGSRTVVGYCVGFAETSAFGGRLRPIKEVVDREVLIDAKLMTLARWIARRYRAGLGDTLDCMVPAAVRAGRRGRAERIVVLSVPADVALAKADELRERHRARSAVLSTLVHADTIMSPTRLAAAAGVSPGVVATLGKAGLVKVVERSRGPLYPADTSPRPRLTGEQAQALARALKLVGAGGFHTVLVHGVTASGKTELYMRIIERVLFSRGGEPTGKQAIVLVPEIALTPQTVARFSGRFGEVAVLHSNLRASERCAEWRRIKAGRVKLVVGARSAVFAPTPNLGLIVIDEEHEGTFKQDRAPRYHARDVAVARAEMEGVPLVVGSATPSLESFSLAATGRAELLHLAKRVEGRPLPPVEIVDMRREKPTASGGGLVSLRLERLIRRALDDDEQVILLLNRRGFARYVSCRRCGFVLRCLECDISLVYHRAAGVAKCHYCEHTTKVPERCPECLDGNLRCSFYGTERVEERLGRMFPDAPVARMDSDTMRRPGSHARTLAAFRRGEVRILLGTQMIAKGLDFPNVTLVGVINADVALNLPDFRASERTFQLLTQVAGRSGRGPKGGCVVVQTYNPEAECIRLAKTHDYISFARSELAQRKTHAYPPFSALARLVVTGREEQEVHSAAEAVAAALAGKGRQKGDRHLFSEEKKSVPVLLGPAPAPIGRIRGQYRYHIVVKAPDHEALDAFFDRTLEHVKVPSRTKLIVDVDPVSML